MINSIYDKQKVVHAENENVQFPIEDQKTQEFVQSFELPQKPTIPSDKLEFDAKILCPTQRHLLFNPIENIIATLDPGCEKKIEYLLDISKKETKETFFGYHGMTQNNRLFQDILHSVFEEVLHINLPKNFYFLRISGEDRWNWKKGMESFLETFGMKPLPETYKESVIQNLLKIIEKHYGVELKIDVFSSEEKLKIWQYFQTHIENMALEDSDNRLKKYLSEDECPLQKPDFKKHQSAVIDVIEKKLLTLYPDSESFRQWFENKFADSYDVSVVFYLRELKLEDTEEQVNIDRYFYPYNDTLAPYKDNLVSLNVPLFGNYEVSGCFTPQIILENESILGNDNYLKEDLSKFFEEIGLDPSIVSSLWEEGLKILKDASNDQGCLLQFYDESSSLNQKPFSFVDKNVYVSLKHGLPVPNFIPSDYIQGKHSIKNKSRDLELRMVMNNQTTLNPFSTMRMIRYDGSSKEDSEKIILTMKDAMKDCIRDENKLKLYCELLESIWKR